MEKITQDIKAGKYEKVYLLFGEESYLVRYYKNHLRQALIGDDTMNFTGYSGKGLDLPSVRESIMTMPFFADRRLILLEDTGLCKSASDGWSELVGEIPDGSYVVFVEKEVDKRNKLYKAIGKAGYCAELKKQDERSLKRWILGQLSRQNLKITENALELFLYKAGDEMENIQMELEKLSSYCMGKEGITAEDVEAVCVERTVNRVFDLIEAAAMGNDRKALDLYYDLVALKEPGMRILFLIARQMNQLYQVREMMTARMGKEDIAAKMKLRPFIAGKLMSQTRAFDKGQLRMFVERCVETEAAVKSGNLSEQIGVEMIILTISRRKKTGGR